MATLPMVQFLAIFVGGYAVALTVLAAVLLAHLTHHVEINEGSAQDLFPREEP